MDWRRPGDKSLSEPMIVSLLTHICVTRPQWVQNQSNLAGHNCQTLQTVDTIEVSATLIKFMG